MGQFGQIDVSHQKLENLQDCLKEHLKTQLLQEPAFYVNVNKFLIWVDEQFAQIGQRLPEQGFKFVHNETDNHFGTYSN